MHISPTPDVKPDPPALTRAEIDRVLMNDPPATYQAPPFGSAQPMKRTSDPDHDGDVFHGSCSNNVGTGEPIPLASDGSIITKPAPTVPAPYEPTAEERAEVDAWRLEAGTQ